MSKNKNVTKKDNSKLVNALIIIGIVFLILSLVLMFRKTNNDNHLMEINYNEYREKIAEDKYTIILLTSPTCSHCINYRPYVNLVAEENNLTVYDINLNNLEYEQYIEIHDKYNIIKNEYDSKGNPVIPTPVTIITKNGEEITSILGDIGSKGFTNLLKTNGVIK